MTVFIALDQSANTLIGGNPDETISARSCRARDAGKLWGKIVAGALDRVFPGHVECAAEQVEKRAEAVIELEDSDKLQP